MAKKYYDGGVLTTTATSDLEVGQVVKLGDRIGVSQMTVVTGELVTIDTEGVYGIAGEATDDFTLGATVYWDDANKVVTLTDNSGANIEAGFVWEPRGAVAGDVLIKINA